MSISIDGLSEAIEKELTLYSEKIVKGINKEAKSHMAQLVAETRASAPTRRGVYKSSISSKKLSENSKGASYLWYVKGSAYRLSHLLEYGHATKNGGRTKAYGFIQAAYGPIEESYLKAIEEVIKNG